MVDRKNPSKLAAKPVCALNQTRQPRVLRQHQKPMYRSSHRSRQPAALALIFSSVIVAASIVGLNACSTKDNPDEIRQRTAEATATMKRDAKAVAEGVKEGMSRDKTLNINKASREDLLTLPGITERQADRIIAERPFDDAHDLVTRRALSQEEYEKIRDRVIASH
jgi:DNA uptake protein ComE-like DNA-binding protein